MNVLHLVEGPIQNSVYRAFFGFHKELLGLGIESSILTKNDDIAKDSVYRINEKLKDKAISKSIGYVDSAIPFRVDRNNPYNMGLFGHDFLKTEPYKKADIIHLHWVNNGWINIRDLKKIRKPIVWTMRDMWAITGGCHYAIDCEKYRKGCGDCCFLKYLNKNDLSSYIVRAKKKYIPKSLRLIGISPWLTKMALESAVFKGFRVETINNGINCDDYFPVDKNISKYILDIETEKKIVLTGATNLSAIYKGFAKYLEAVEGIDKDKYYLCFFGEVDENQVEKTGFEYKLFGYLEDIVTMRLLYSASDVFVASSIMEAFGKTIVESMLCGTPVVCFDATGPKYIVNHKVNGYKALPFSSEDMAAGIEWVVNNNNRYLELSKNARDDVLEKYDNKIVAKKYVKLYEEMMHM